MLIYFVEKFKVIRKGTIIDNRVSSAIKHMLSGKYIQLLTEHAVHVTCDIVETTEKPWYWHLYNLYDMLLGFRENLKNLNSLIRAGTVLIINE